MKRNIKKVAQAVNTARLLTKWFFPPMPHDPFVTLQKTEKFFTKHLSSGSSLLDTVSEFKKHRLLFLKLLDPDTAGTGYSPILTGRLMKAIREGDTYSIRFASTVFLISRPLRRSGTPDITSITDKPVTDFSSEIEKFRSGLLVNWSPKECGELPPWEAPHSTRNAGPQGPALATAYADLEILPEALLEDFAELAPDLFNYIYGKAFRCVKDEGILHISKSAVKARRKGGFRAISVINDRELKLRPVALLDYGSQAALKPLHDTIFKRLRDLKSDFTFDQVKGCEYLTKIKPTGNYHSLDLVSATDRFPIDIQKVVLEQLYGKDFSEAGSRVLTKYPYRFVNNPDVEVIYGTGQPMGAYSSGAVFTLTHHLIVKYCADNIQYDKYAILGDDIVLTDDTIAAKYNSLMNSLGVEISQPKTIISKYMFEFAKRLYFRGKEVSGFPLSAVTQSLHSVSTLAITLCGAVKDRNGQSPNQGGLNRDMVNDFFPPNNETKRWFAAYKGGERVLLNPLVPNDLGNKIIRFCGTIGNTSCFLKESTVGIQWITALASVLSHRTNEASEILATVVSDGFDGRPVKRALNELGRPDLIKGIDIESIQLEVDKIRSEGKQPPKELLDTLFSADEFDYMGTIWSHVRLIEENKVRDDLNNIIEIANGPEEEGYKIRSIAMAGTPFSEDHLSIRGFKHNEVASKCGRLIASAIGMMRRFWGSGEDPGN